VSLGDEVPLDSICGSQFGVQCVRFDTGRFGARKASWGVACMLRLVLLLLYFLGCAQCSVQNVTWLVSRVRLGLGCCCTPHSALHVWCGTWVGGSETALAGLARLMTGYMQWLYDSLRLTAVAILTGDVYYVMVAARVFLLRGASLCSQPGLLALGRVRGIRRALHSCIWRVDPRAQCIYVRDIILVSRS